MPATVMEVRPRGWESSPEFSRFTVPLIGYIMPKAYISMVDIFKLTDKTDHHTIVQNMVAGLEHTLSQFPILAGILQMNSVNGEMWVSKRKESGVLLHVKHVLDDNESLKYDELAKHHFPTYALPPDQLLPGSVTSKPLHPPSGETEEEGVPISTFQMNFIPGGFILGISIHHVVFDGTSCDGFLIIWAESSRAAANGASFPPAKYPYSIQNPMDVEVPKALEMEDLQDEFPQIKNLGGPMKSILDGGKMPTITDQMFHFSNNKLELLKRRASAGVDEGWISTYDAIIALIWGSVTRSKLDMLNPDPNSTAVFMQAINTRKLWDPPLPENFNGVAAFATLTKPQCIKDIIDPTNLGTLASVVRASHTNTTPAYLSSVLRWIAGQPDKRYLGFSINSFLGIDFAASSWAKMRVHEMHDFGFGRAMALRRPNPRVEGFVYVYPSRAGMEGADMDEGVEVGIGLEDGCMKRLMQDEVLLEFASPRG